MFREVFIYAIIDEVDSILIDEARTPLIISGDGKDVSKIYIACDALAKKMIKGEETKEFNKIDALLGDMPEETGDFIYHEKERNITLTEAGVKKVEKYFGIDNYADRSHAELQHVMDLALRANYTMFKDKDYIVRDGSVLLLILLQVVSWKDASILMDCIRLLRQRKAFLFSRQQQRLQQRLIRISLENTISFPA